MHLKFGIGLVQGASVQGWGWSGREIRKFSICFGLDYSKGSIGDPGGPRNLLVGSVYSKWGKH